MYKQTTPIPNILLDRYLPSLSVAELKILLVILRQTNGWVDKKTRCRKTRDRISHNQFIQKTGLSRRVISYSLKKLFHKGFIRSTDTKGNDLVSGSQRSGRSDIFYTSTCAIDDTNLCKRQQKPVQKVLYNKTNYTKLNKTKGGVSSVSEIVAKMVTNPNYIPGYPCTDFMLNGIK